MKDFPHLQGYTTTGFGHFLLICQTEHRHRLGYLVAEFCHRPFPWDGTFSWSKLFCAGSHSKPAHWLIFRCRWDILLAVFNISNLLGRGWSWRVVAPAPLRLRFRILTLSVSFVYLFFHFTSFVHSNILCSCSVEDLRNLRTFPLVVLGFYCYYLDIRQYLTVRGDSIFDSWYFSPGYHYFGFFQNWIGSLAGGYFDIFFPLP